MVVGRFNSSHTMSNLNIIQTYEEATESTISKPRNRLIGLLNMLKVIHKYRPKALIIEHTEIEAILFAFLLRIYTKLSRQSYIKLILKLDADPDSLRITKDHFIPVFYRYMFTRLFDKIACESECTYVELIEPKIINRYKDKYVIVPNGVLSNIDGGEVNAYEMRRNVILSVGRIHPQKGHDILIKVFSKLKDKFQEWKLRIIGSSSDESYMNSLKKQISDLNLGNSVELKTDVSYEELIKEYRQASIFCLLSRWGSFEIARTEAVHYGLSMVITEAGCGIHYQKFGSFVCDVNDERCIVKSLSTLMSNADLRVEILEKQKSAVVTWHDVALEFTKLIENRE
ncbi:glycosyltransferase [Picrophilus oshimae]|nr:glycosyltransferase [Picrophilus oshimae]